MNPPFVVLCLIIILTMPSAFARDYSYMDDHPSSNTQTSPTTKNTPTTMNTTVLESVVSTAVGASMNSVFSEEEKSIIRRYYHADEKREPRYSSDDDYDEKKYKKHKKYKKKNKKKSLPPGLRKKVARGGELPPGWQKKMQRGEVMERDLYYQSRPLPIQLRQKLPEMERGSQVREIEGKVVKVLDATGVIIDVFDF